MRIRMYTRARVDIHTETCGDLVSSKTLAE